MPVQKDYTITIDNTTFEVPLLPNKAVHILQEIVKLSGTTEAPGDDNARHAIAVLQDKLIQSVFIANEIEYSKQWWQEAPLHSRNKFCVDCLYIEKENVEYIQKYMITPSKKKVQAKTTGEIEPYRSPDRVNHPALIMALTATGYPNLTPFMYWYKWDTVMTNYAIMMSSSDWTNDLQHLIWPGTQSENSKLVEQGSNGAMMRVFDFGNEKPVQKD